MTQNTHNENGDAITAIIQEYTMRYLLYLRYGLKNQLILRKEDDFTGLAETHKSNSESKTFNSTS